MKNYDEGGGCLVVLVLFGVAVFAFMFWLRHVDYRECMAAKNDHFVCSTYAARHGR